MVSTLDGPVLEVLSRTTRSLTGREVHRLTGTGSPNGVRLALARLTEQGVVHAEQRSNAVFYSANREHLTWPAVQCLTALRSTLIRSLGDELTSWQCPPAHASLFGSAARGDGDATSDIDILLIRPDDVPNEDPLWDKQVDDLRERVWKWTGNRCHAFELDRHRLAEHVVAKDPLVDALLRDAIDLAGRDLGTILKDLADVDTNR
ncbi:nucleotidyltransferase domain-containing protein [Mycolicibacterium wolinskyi]|uniref:nucleotidyltransferase domain-containing protein n=1 Tax=Mycolicibacterium wolinskyi TaxID=59750 RepID=UPI0039178B5C